MHGPSSAPPPDSPPIVAVPIGTAAQAQSPPMAPPVVAPPIVRPPYCEYPLSLPAQSLHGDPQSFRSRSLRIVMFGGVCLVVGMIVAQGRSFPHQPTRTFALPNARALPDNDTSTRSSVVDASVQRLVRSDPIQERVFAVSAPHRNAIEDTDNDVVSKATGPCVMSAEEPHIKYSLLCQRSSGKPQTLLGEVKPAGAFKAIVAAQTSMKSLAMLGTQSTFIPTPPQCQDDTCREGKRALGTVLNWAATPGDAYRMADQADKLVFLIHVSGNFEIPGFT